MRACFHACFCLAGLVFIAPGAAREPAVVRLEMQPPEIVLSSPWDRVQLVVTGHCADGSVVDLTNGALVASNDARVATITPGKRVEPRALGRTTFVARWAAHELQVPVSVADNAEHSVSFVRQVVPALTRAGCNAGACHGDPSGKNGFRLSLRGYEPAADHVALTRDSGGRRVDPQSPDSSLILLKATARVPHEGGRRFGPDSDLYRLLRGWVAQGAGNEAEASTKLTRLQVFPEQRVLEAPADRQQLRLVAHFVNGMMRDVTHLARFSVNDESIAQATTEGVVEKRKKGEVAVAAEYLGMMATARIIFLDSRPGFTWPNPPEHGAIDRHVFAKLKLLRIEPSGLCRDDEFLRRAYLDAIGKLPTPDEVRRFLADNDPNKREKVIDGLLERPEFADWWALKWADRLGCNQRFVGKIGALKYHQWIRHAMAINLPEDEFVRAILTAQGGNYENPPAGFYRRLRDPQTRAEEAAQLFLGVRLQCARCHNHPGERWTQEDYHRLAAFFARVKYRDGPFFIQQYDKEETVYLAREGEVAHPRTGAVLLPKFLGGDQPSFGPLEDRRAALAGWLTAAENPFFAKAAANRIWYHLFGRGIVEPVDDLRSTNPPANADLLDHLAAQFVKHGFNRKHLIATIMKSRTYQLSAHPTATNEEDDKYFSHAGVRLLRAEALLDAIAQATGVPEKFPSLPLGTPAARLPDGEYKHPFLEAFGRPARAMACECERDTDTNLSQALHLIGGLPIHKQLASDSGRIAKLIADNKSNEEIVEELFLASVSRLPTLEERRTLLKHLAPQPPTRREGREGEVAARRKTAEDILWALINHREFLFQH